jgi:hypothetical protein
VAKNLLATILARGKIMDKGKEFASRGKNRSQKVFCHPFFHSGFHGASPLMGIQFSHCSLLISEEILKKRSKNMPKHGRYHLSIDTFHETAMVPSSLSVIFLTSIR